MELKRIDFSKRVGPCLCAALVGALLALAPLASSAQGYPTRAIKIVVPFAPGGTTDLLGRLIAPVLSEQLGQPVLIENRAGAGGLIGADAVAKSAPDGYTLLLTNISYPLAVLTAQRAKRATFDALADLAPVSIIANVPTIVTAPPSVPAKDLREFASLLQRDKSLAYAYGSTGPGSYLNVFGESFQREAKVSMIHVPFKGTAPIKQEMLAGRIQLGGDQLSSSLGEIRAGTLRALATTGSKRAALLPDVPTVRELGFPGLEAEGWNGVFAAAKTPPAILVQVQKAIAAALSNSEVARRLRELGAEASGSTGAELDQLLRGQLAQFGPVIATIPLD
jgi:tripartite-type tricarboxylate transporter receptor subunit TctC